jgi:hypothetical protein
MPNLPARLTDRGSPGALRRATRDTEQTKLSIYRHHLDARRRAEFDRIDSQAIADVARSALDAEMDVLDSCMAKAGDSTAKRELVARMVALQSDIDIRRISRRFGE